MKIKILKYIQEDLSVYFNFPKFNARVQATSSLAIQIFRVSFGIGLISTILSGCLITSPHWFQEFDSHEDEIPIQAWTFFGDQPVHLECSKAFHGGLFPAFGTPTWHPVTTLYPQQPGLLDPKGNRVFSLGDKLVLPEVCWRLDPAYDDPKFFTAIRMTQSIQTSTGFQELAYAGFDRDGLECLGKETGKDASWWGYYNKDCEKSYSNGNPIKFVRIIANG